MRIVSSGLKSKCTGTQIKAKGDKKDIYNQVASKRNKERLGSASADGCHDEQVKVIGGFPVFFLASTFFINSGNSTKKWQKQIGTGNFLVQVIVDRFEESQTLW